MMQRIVSYINGLLQLRDALRYACVLYERKLMTDKRGDCEAVRREAMVEAAMMMRGTG